MGQEGVEANWEKKNQQTIDGFTTFILYKD
jgi:hypothetical protein